MTLSLYLILIADALSGSTQEVYDDIGEKSGSGDYNASQKSSSSASDGGECQLIHYTKQF